LALVGPVFQKELLEAARRKRYLFLRCVVPTFFFFAVLMVWADSPYRGGYMTVMQQQSRAGRDFFEAWMFLVTVTLGVAAPMLAGGLIAAERERGSLDLLFTTDLSSREIVLGKAASRVAILWLMAFGSAPALEIIAVLGGVSFGTVFGVLVITLSGVTFVTAVGLFYSAVTKRPWIAVIRTYFLFGILWFVIPLSLAFGLHTLGRMFDLGNRFEERFFSELPFLLAMHLPYCLITQIEPRAAMRATPFEFAAWNSAFSWAAAAFFVFLAHRNLREIPRRVSKPWWTAPFRWMHRIWHWVRGRFRILESMGRIVPKAKPHQLDGLLDRQPVAWRNLKAGVFDPDQYLYRIQRFLTILLCAFMGIGTAAYGRMSAGDLVVFVMMTVLVIHFLLGVLIAGSVSRERERGSLDLLRMTMLTPNQIVFGNEVGAFRAVRLSLTALLGLMAYAVLFEVFTLHFTIAYFSLLLVGMACLASQAMLVSTAAPNTLTAMACTVVVGGIWWIAPVMLEDRDSRGVALGVVAATIPLALLPMNRRPVLVHWAVCGLGAAVVLGLLASSRFDSSVAAFAVCLVAALLSRNWLQSRFVPARLAAACVCCVTIPLVVGLLACSLFNVDLRSCDDVLCYAYFVTEVDRSQLSMDNYMRRLGSSRWSGNHSDWAPAAFFFITIIATGIIHAVTLKAFPKLSEPA
jgi:ABC-type transport system involved in multi-copper enzyme maturation permease subunit